MYMIFLMIQLIRTETPSSLCRSRHGCLNLAPWNKLNSKEQK